MSIKEYNKLQKKHSLHLKEEDWDHFNCIICYGFRKQLEELDPSKDEFNRFIQKNKGKIVLLPNPDNIFTFIVCNKTKGSVEKTIYKIMTSNYVKYLPYLYRQ